MIGVFIAVRSLYGFYEQLHCLITKRGSWASDSNDEFE